MTLLTICQAAADQLDLGVPDAIIGSSLPDVRKLLRYANKVGLRLMRAHPWQVLRAELAFTATAAELQVAVIPADFDRFIPETFWDRTNVVLVSGPVSAVEWQGLKAGSYSDTAYPRFAYRGGDVRILPAPAAVSMAFEYVSNLWCADSGATGQTAWAADDDVGVLDEELITLGVVYEYLRGEGLPFEVAAADYLDTFNMLTTNDQPNVQIATAGDIFGPGRHFGGAPTARSGSIL